MIDIDNNTISEKEEKNNNVDDIADVHVYNEVLNDESQSMKNDSENNIVDIKRQCKVSIDNHSSIQNVNERIDIIWHCFFVIILFMLTYFVARVGKFDYGPHLKGSPTINDWLSPFQYFKRNSEPLWHYLTSLMRMIFQIPLKDCGAIVSGICNVAVYEIIYNYLKKYTTKANIVAFICLIAGPIWMPWYNKGRIYLGQGSPNTWHNPTVLMVRPFAYLVLFQSMKMFEKPIFLADYKKEWKAALMIYILLFFSALAKPAFYQVFFPAIFIYCVALVLINHGDYFWNAFLLFLSCIPTVLLFVLQFVLIFFLSKVAKSGDAGGQIGVQFWAVAKVYSPNPIFSLFLASAFPIAVLLYILIFKKKTDRIYWFSWVMYVCSVIEKWILVEKNVRQKHGNFAWGFIIALSIIFFVSLREYIDIVRNKNNSEKNLCNKLELGMFVACTVLLIAHVIVGAIYIYRIIMLLSYV